MQDCEWKTLMRIRNYWDWHWAFYKCNANTITEKIQTGIELTTLETQSRFERLSKFVIITWIKFIMNKMYNVGLKTACCSQNNKRKRPCKLFLVECFKKRRKHLFAKSWSKRTPVVMFVCWWVLARTELLNFF